MSYTPSTRPGSRAPHAWIGEGRSTLDLYGTGFTLLRLGASPPDAEGLHAAAKDRGVPLQVIALANPAVAKAYEAPLVLVRPDGHVAWRGNVEPEDPAQMIDRIRGAAVSGALPIS
jgi:hypothetical protein